MAKRKVLIVDDSPTQLNMMKAPFEENGFLVPTPLGEKLIDALAGKFTFADFDFTSGME